MQRSGSIRCAGFRGFAGVPEESANVTTTPHAVFGAGISPSPHGFVGRDFNAGAHICVRQGAPGAAGTKVSCWGNTERLLSRTAERQLRGGAVIPREWSEPWLPSARLVKFEDGEWVTCFLEDNGTLTCALGGSLCTLMAPVATPSANDCSAEGVSHVNAGAIDVAAGNGVACFVSAVGEVWCSQFYDGMSDSTSLGDATGLVSRTPKRVGLGGNAASPLTSVVKIVGVDQGGFYALRNDGTLYRWGHLDSSGATLPEVVTGAAVAGDPDVLHIDGGENVVNTVCAVVDGGAGPNTVRCFGTKDAIGASGLSHRTYANAHVVDVPTDSGTHEATRVSVGFDHACALRSDGKVFCWGRNEQGQLGRDPVTPLSHTPVEIPGLTAVVDVMAFGDTTCALQADTAVKCWGRNDGGQTLGNSHAGWDNPITARMTDGTALVPATRQCSVLSVP